jgi:hypothetical protein
LLEVAAQEEEDPRVSFADDAKHALAARFRAAPRASELSELRDLLVRYKGGEPFDQPYVPMIGADFRPREGVLVYATAQNMRDDSYAPGDDAMFRLWEPQHWNKVLIRPWSDGILPALAGVLHSVHLGEVIPSLDEVVGRCAISNFFKVSLRRRDRSGDLNPVTGLPHKISLLHTERTWEDFVRHEIEILRPRMILCFKGKHQELLARQTDVPVFECNDPAWIKRGMRLAGGENGSWTRRAGEATEQMRALVDGYLSACSRSYSGGRRANSTTYLLNYSLRWRKSGNGTGGTA